MARMADTPAQRFPRMKCHSEGGRNFSVSVNLIYDTGAVLQ
jgi:hypothetical protein